MVKQCIVETQRGIKLGAGRVINPNVPIELSGRDIFSLFKKNGVKVYELVNGDKIQLTPENYLDDNSNNIIIEDDEEKIEEPVDNIEVDTAKTEDTANDTYETPVEETVIDVVEEAVPVVETVIDVVEEAVPVVETVAEEVVVAEKTYNKPQQYKKKK